MSRIGKKPVPVPSGVKVVNDTPTRTLSVEGPKGKLRFTYRPEVSVVVDDAAKVIRCSIPESAMEDGQSRAYWGTTRSRIAGMIDGVSKGFTEKLEVVGVGWNAKVQGKTLQLAIGFCNPVNLPIPDGLAVQVDNNTMITITGPDKQAVGQFASAARAQRKPEPYNGKGVKYVDEVIQRKQGKAFGATAA
jgi:large subunit ribosomal protein L6